MSISTLAQRVVVTIHRQATTEDAASLMRSSHIGDVVVVDAANTRVPVGMITDRDIVVKVIAQGLIPAQTPVGSVMSSPVLTLREEDGFIEALDKMSAHGVRRAPVVDRDGNLRGLISVDDLVPLLARELAKIGALIRHGQAAEIQKTEHSLSDEFAT
ncbi:MAG: CBS domain-containing protein [Betaproteobacteria bacterium]|nr:CBS domain-containing protein [Betaproteobacteria bacterium]